MESHIFYQYFDYERVSALAIEFILFIFLFLVYLKLRKSKKEDWVPLLRKAVGFLVLAPALALFLDALGFIVLGDRFENYVGVITVVSFNIPIALSTYYFYKLSHLSNA